MIINDPFFGRHLLAVNGHCYRHAIGIENYLVVTSVTISKPEEKSFQAQIVTMPLQAFLNGWQLQIGPYYNFARPDEIRNRAVSLIGQYDTYTFDITGFNFVYWCLTGQPLQPDNFLIDAGKNEKIPIFGQQLLAKRGIYEHHGIGIEGGYVVHFGTPEQKSQNWGNQICIVRYETFKKGSEVLPVNYRRERAFDLVQTRNRALNSLGIPQYHLLANNCEHFATWCVTGVKRSVQVENIGKVLGGLVVAGATALFISALENAEKAEVEK
jgi:hypothetical protein